MPVFNGAATLSRAAESALGQTCNRILVHISDNASTDATARIARELAARHPQVRFTRHEHGLGISGNFGFLLQQTETEYFMWLAADDYIAPTYVERLLAAMEADSTLVACTARAVFVHSDGTAEPAGGTYSLLGDRVANLAAYLSAPSDNSRIFGLYRTRALKAAFPTRYFHAYDWAIAAGTLLHGRHLEIPAALLMRDQTPLSAYIAAIKRDNRSALRRVFPVLEMTADLVLRQRIPLRWPVIKALLKLNLEMHTFYAGRDHGRYGETMKRLLQRHLLWRLASSPPPVPYRVPAPAGPAESEAQRPA